MTKPIENIETRSMTLGDYMRALGPGILLAGAAIGGSHIYQSTRAGASFGWGLVWAVALANILKYPFFYYAIRYQAATGKNLLHGFKAVHPLLLYLVIGIVYVSGALNITALTIGSGALLANYFSGMFGENLSMLQQIQGWSIGVVVASLIIILVGRYRILDLTTKIIVSVLSVSTVVAFFMALSKGSQALETVEPSQVFVSTSVAAMLALMGWMPLPIDASIWPTLWSCEKSEQQGHKMTLKEQIFDFNFGYISAAVLAFFFLGLGALVLYRTGIDLEASNTAFATQLMGIYELQFGPTAKWLVGIAAATALFSSALTCYDAYPRTLYYSGMEFFDETIQGKYTYRIIGALSANYGVISILVVFMFMKNVTAIVDYATIVAFLTAPVMAVANLLVVLHRDTPAGAKPGKGMLAFGIAGIVFLSSFSILYLYIRFFQG